MQCFPEFNAHLAAKNFDADAFAIVLYLGGPAFVKYYKVSKIGFRKGNATRTIFLQIDMQPHEWGFNRLEIYHIGDESVRMEFYSIIHMPGSNPHKGQAIVMENVRYEDMSETFKKRIFF